MYFITCTSNLEYATHHTTFSAVAIVPCFHSYLFKFPILIHSRNKMSISRSGFCSLHCTGWECRLLNEVSSCLFLLYVKWWGFITAILLSALNPVILHRSGACWTTTSSPVVTNLKLNGLLVTGWLLFIDLVSGYLHYLFCWRSSYVHTFKFLGLF